MVLYNSLGFILIASWLEASIMLDYTRMGFWSLSLAFAVFNTIALLSGYMMEEISKDN